MPEDHRIPIPSEHQAVLFDGIYPNIIGWRPRCRLAGRRSQHRAARCARRPPAPASNQLTGKKLSSVAARGQSEWHLVPPAHSPRSRGPEV